MGRLFVYGTLRDSLVQQAVLGRMLPGTPAVLDGYGRFETTLESGSYSMIRPQAGGTVSGLAIEVTADDLVRLDAYETEAYQRIRVSLHSGVDVWVYAEPD